MANDVASAVGRPNKFPSSGPPPGLPCFCLARPAKYGDASKQVSFWLSFKDKKHGGRVLRKRVRIMLNRGRIGLVAIVERFIVEILACIEDINQGWQMEAKIYYARMYPRNVDQVFNGNSLLFATIMRSLISLE